MVDLTLEIYKMKVNSNKIILKLFLNVFFFVRTTYFDTFQKNSMYSIFNSDLCFKKLLITL